MKKYFLVERRKLKFGLSSFHWKKKLKSFQQNTNFLSPNDFVFHLITSQNMFFFKNLYIISFSSNLRVRYMYLLSLILIYLLHNFTYFCLSEFYGTLHISCVYNNHWCLSYASLSFIASIF